MHQSAHGATPITRGLTLGLAILFGLLALTLGPLPSAHAAGVIYVRSSATGANNGSSWTDAYTNVQTALSAASSGDQIWVAAGTYTPSTTGDRSASFVLKNGVAVYGGFAGAETQLSQRDWTTNPTILSGDLNGDDSGFTNNVENSYHVVVGATGATLDGFTIKGGNANGSGTANSGGGIYNSASSPTLTNLTISGNQAGFGGALFNHNASSTTLTNVTISGNSVTNNGGGIYNNGSSPTLTNVTISSNTAEDSGGGIYNGSGSHATLMNVTITSNSATWDGAGMYSSNSSPTLTNVTISGNSGSDGSRGSGIILFSGAPILINVVISGNTSDLGGGIYVGSNSNPTLTNVTIAGNLANQGGGFYSFSGNPTLTNVTIAGNLANQGGGLYNNDANPTLTNVTIAGNRAISTAGGLYSFSGSPKIRNSIVWGNRAGTAVSSIAANFGTPVVSYSLVEGGYSGTGNRSSDPLFISATDAASAPSTSGDYHLQLNSPAIDAGNNGVSSPSLPATDRDSKPRQIDIVGITDTGSGTAPIVDMGAYEARFPEVSSITRATPASSTTNAASVTFQVVFDDSLTGIETSDFAATAIEGALDDKGITSVSGSGSTYIVTVATGIGSGVLRLDVPSTAQATNDAGISGNLLPYTSGETYTIDKTAPDAPIITGITTDSRTAGDGITNDRTLVFDGTAEAGSTVTLTHAGQGVIGTTTAEANGVWVFDYTGTILEDGSYSFTATASDPAGNISASSSPFAVTVQRVTWYVNDDTTGADDGTSWTDAFSSLQSALAIAQSGDQIWVAAGTYTPTTTGDRTASFTLTSGAAVYGGFAGTETQLSERDWTNNVTTLSGDIGASGDTSDNSYHVVTGANDATLDGFTISGGKADGVDPYNKGGGIYNAAASPVLRNLTVSDNASSNRGGGIYNTNSNPTLTNLIVRNNTSAGGAGVYNLNSSPTMSDITISQNQASQSAGGLWNSSSSPTLTNVTIQGNTTGAYGGGIYNTGSSSPILTDVTIEGNTASGHGGGMMNLCSCSPTLTNVTIRSNTAGYDGGGIYNSGSSPTLTNVTISGNQVSTNGGGIANFNSSSPTLTNVVISGNTAGWGGGLANVTSSSTLTNVTISGNRATWNGGIDNDYSGTLQIRNSIIWGNTTGGSASALTNDHGSTATVSYSIVEGGYVGAGNLSSAPQFLGAVTAASAPTAAGSYRLLTTSPAIDAGDNSVVSATTDLAGNPRRLDISTAADAGSGSAPIVDMGAYEALPVVTISSITRLDPADSLTEAASVQFQVVFAESVSGVELSDFALRVVSGSISGAAITNLSGSGTTYTLTVDTGSGDGVLRLEPAPGAEVLNAASAIRALAPFTTGETYTIDRTVPAAPAITGITTDSGFQASGRTSDPTISLNGTAEAGSTVTLTRVDQGVIGTATADASGAWVFDSTSTSLPFSAFTFTAIATDAIGHISTPSSDFVVTVRAVPAPGVIYVRLDASGANNGTSWADAYTSLVPALAIAGSGDQIWVAAGTYTPSATGDRSASFTLKRGAAVYGGFAGTETQLGQRDWTANATILSGDLAGNDSDFANNGENSYHVVVGATDATLDGFTVTGGNADGSGNLNDSGGGIFNVSASPRLTNLIIRGNMASNAGGGVYNNLGSSPTLTNVTLSGNSAQDGGALATATSSSPILTNVLISGNRAIGSGGGIIASAGSNLTLTNVTIAGNLASTGSGGGIFIVDGDLQMQNSIMWENRSFQVFPLGYHINSIHRAESTTTTVHYSLVQGGNDGIANLDVNPQFVSEASALSAPTTAGNYHLETSSPAIDRGSTAALPADTFDLDADGNTTEALPYDLDHHTRRSGTVDMGAYEVDYCTPYTFPYTVPAGDSAALGTAIRCANSDPDANVINLTTSTYTFTAGDAINADSALPRVTSSLTINGNGATLERASGAPDFRLLSIEGGVVTLDQVTVTGGEAGLGGGIYNIATLTLQHSTVISNTADDAGGIRNEGSLTVIDSTITSNRASGFGGGIDNINNLTIVSSRITNNTANAGAGIRNEAAATIISSTIADNSATSSGGGIANIGGVKLVDSTISGNQVTGSSLGGGGIFNTNTTTVINSAISGNSVTGTSVGGGILSMSGYLALTNSVLSGNSAPNGGGVALSSLNGSGSAVMTNTTLASNMASSTGGGILLESGTLTATNSILWGNSSQVQGSPSITSSLVQGGYAGIGNLNSDPQFVSPVPFADAPTTSGDYHLQSASPAVNAGSSAALPADDDDLDGDSNTAEPLPIDRDGNARIALGAVDLGAYEWQANLPPTLTLPVDLTILEDAGAQTVYLTGISSIGGQALSVTASSSNPALIPAPTVNYTSPNANGSLAFVPIADANGSTTITIRVQNSGGTATGGSDTLVHSFTVTVTAVNDVPRFTAGPNQRVEAGAGQQVVSGWASGFNAGPANEASQTLLGYTVVSNTAPDLFTAAPAIDSSGTLIYTPKSGARGTATIGVVVRDSGGTVNDGSDTSAVQTFTITVSGSYSIYLPLVLR